MYARMVVQSLFGFLWLGVMLFVPAGRLDWPQAWAFMVLFIGAGLAIGLWLAKAHPDVLAARMRPPLSGVQKGSDRAIMAALLIAFVGWFIFMGFDARVHWSPPVPLWAEAIGAGLLLYAFYGWYRVLAVNAFAATTIELQSDRGQTVISTGPYAVVRHPMYAFALLFFAGIALLLGSLWGLAGLLVFTPILMLRAAGEEAMLREGLAGYVDYAQKVRWRLVPLVW
ncbi:MAG TPA: isoprenylcysteine carboxylmethyltransferase family protein [Caulobacteraceae bacterium]|jgi:protein-S-isoprenylcysteine O-methyltransferase Ste14